MEYLPGISVFVAAVEAGGFSEAARRLNLSRSAVGKTIAKLEERLNARLFHRTTRTQSLTGEGYAYYEHCKRAMAELRAGRDALETGRQEIVGRLRISMPVLFGRYCVLPVLTTLARQHPGLEFEMSFSDRNVNILEEGFDLVVRSGGLPASEGLMARRIAEQKMYLCASPAYLDANGTPGTVEELNDHLMLAYSSNGRLRTWLVPQPDGKIVEVIPTARMLSDDLEAIADIAAAGMGIAWLPCWLIRERVTQGKLLRIMPQQTSFGFDIRLLWPQTPYLPCRTRVTIDALAESLPSMMN